MRKGKRPFGAKGIRIDILNMIIFALISIVAVFALNANVHLGNRFDEMVKSRNDYIEGQESARDLQNASDNLTSQVEYFVITGEVSYLQAYFDEIALQRREKAIENLRGTVLDSSLLDEAKKLSDELMLVEFHAMKLVVTAKHLEGEEIPEKVAGYTLPAQEQGMSEEEQLQTARGLIFGDEYIEVKKNISGMVENSCGGRCKVSFQTPDICAALSHECSGMEISMTKQFDYLKWSKRLGIGALLVCTAIILWGWAHGDFNSVDSLKTYINGFGILGPCILIMVQAFQVIFPVLPGFAGCIVGSVLFSWLGGFVCNYVGICAGSIIAFLLAKRFGTPAVEKLIPMEKYEKWSKRATNSKCYALLLFLCILLPLAPDDYLCYLSGLMNMSSRKFVGIILLGKPWCILVYCIFTGYFI